MMSLFFKRLILKYRFLSVALILFTGSAAGEFIITRHDKSDDEYIKFAQELPVTSSIIKYNSTDLAGTLISPQWVLSAAHVAEFVDTTHIFIIDGDSVGVEKVIIHPDWTENNRPDLALIKLNRKIEHISPVPLYENTDEIGKQVIIAGIGDYGTGKTGVEGNPGIMRAATNLVENSTNDSHYLYWVFDYPDSDKVTQLEGVAGPGDSAGPAFLKIDDVYYLAGIGSAQSTQATGGIEGLYGVTEYYVRVSTFIDWIEKTISEE